MPKKEHETIIEMFRNRPELAPELLSEILGYSVPDYRDIRVESGEFTDVKPTEYRADVVVSLAEGTPVLGIVVEVQRKIDKEKRWSWPVYVSTLRARLRCPVVLLVICPDARTAAWCAQPIDMGQPGWTPAPLVIGPDAIPPIVDADQAARMPELAVLSALAHGSGAEGTKILDTLAEALATVEIDCAQLYTDFVLGGLSGAARAYLEDLVLTETYEYQSDLARRLIAEGEAKGEARGEAKSVIAVLTARGIAVPEKARERVFACTDPDRLDEWLRLAVTANTTDDLFD